MTWWHWLALGVVLVALELAASGGFYVIFFGIAAIVIGGLHLFDLAGPLWFQLLLFSVISVAALMLFRKPILRWLSPDGAADVDLPIGETAIPLQDIPPGEVGRAELRGTIWSARNVGNVVLSRGQRCTVTRIERLMIHLVAEGAHA